MRTRQQGGFTSSFLAFIFSRFSVQLFQMDFSANTERSSFYRSFTVLATWHWPFAHRNRLRRHQAVRVRACRRSIWRRQPAPSIPRLWLVLSLDQLGVFDFHLSLSCSSGEQELWFAFCVRLARIAYANRNCGILVGPKEIRSHTARRRWFRA